MTQIQSHADVTTPVVARCGCVPGAAQDAIRSFGGAVRVQAFAGRADG